MKQLKYTGEDDWHQPLYKDEETGIIYVEVDGVMHFRTVDWGEPICAVDFEFIRDSVPENPQQFTYMMLDMMKSRVEYFLGWGKGHLRHLNGESIDQHIKEMTDLWNSLKEKPEWLTIDQINEYAQRMQEVTNA